MPHLKKMKICKFKNIYKYQRYEIKIYKLKIGSKLKGMKKNVESISKYDTQYAIYKRKHNLKQILHANYLFQNMTFM